MCGVTVTCRDDGTAWPHQRNDILAMLARGDFDAERGDGPQVTWGSYATVLRRREETKALAKSIGGTVVGQVKGESWLCGDCDAGSLENSERQAGLALYRHRQAAHSGRTEAPDA